MTPNYLKKMLPLLLGADPAQATNVQLVSLAKAFAAGYGLVSSVAACRGIRYGGNLSQQDRQLVLGAV